MTTGTASTVWSTLAFPYSPAGGIPYIGQDGQTPTLNFQQFWFNDQDSAVTGNYSLSVNTGGDQTGTDAVNTYNQYDSFQFNSKISQLNGSYFGSAAAPGFTVSSSQGTLTALSPNLSGDFIGGFSGWGYSVVATVGSWTALAGMFIVAKGAVAGNVGGELHFGTKADGGLITDRVTLDNSGNLFPSTVIQGVSASANLGTANKGWGKLNLNYAIAGTVGGVVQNTPTGKVQLAAATGSITVTNSLVTANSIVLATVQQNDATAVIKNVVTAAGSFTINMAATATAQCTISYLVINTDS